MPSPVYSSRLFAAQGMNSAVGASGTSVPAGFTYVLRDIDAWESSGAANAAFVLYSGFGGAIQIWSLPTAGGDRNVQWRGRQVYAPGETIGFQVASGTWNISACGYRLTNP